MKTIWIFGLPSTGKTSLASKLYNYFNNKNIEVYHFDGFKIRQEENNFDFSRPGREIHISKIRNKCIELNKQGVITIVSAITPYKIMRIQNRTQIKNYFEIFLNISRKTYIERNLELYKKALNKEIFNVSGISDLFEEDKTFDLEIPETYNLFQQFKNVIQSLKSLGFFQK